MTKDSCNVQIALAKNGFRMGYCYSYIFAENRQFPPYLNFGFTPCEFCDRGA